MDILFGVIGCGIVAGRGPPVANSYPWPSTASPTQYAVAHGITGATWWSSSSRRASPNPVLIALGVALIMTILATRRRFGRSVFAIGGNPEAAVLARHQHPAGPSSDLRRVGVLSAV